MLNTITSFQALSGLLGRARKNIFDVFNLSSDIFTLHIFYTDCCDCCDEVAVFTTLVLLCGIFALPPPPQKKIKTL